MNISTNRCSAPGDTAVVAVYEDEMRVNKDLVGMLILVVVMIVVLLLTGGSTGG